MLFYKGTHLSYDAELYDKFLPIASEMIQNGLKAGVSRKTQIQDYTEQLDILEQSIVDCSRGKETYTILDLEVHWEDEFPQHFSVWIPDIIALLELGV